MKQHKNIILIVFFILNLSCKGCPQEPEIRNPDPAGAGSADAKLEELNLVSGRYWHLKGKVGDVPVTMDLIQTGVVSKTSDEDDEESGDLAGCGSYYEDKKGLPHQLFCKWGDGGSLQVTVGIDEEAAGSFDGKLSPEGVFLGTWQGGKKEQQFLLKENAEGGSVRLDLVSFRGESPLFTNVEKSPKAVISITLLSPQKDGAANADFLNKNFFRYVEPGSEELSVFLTRDEFIKKTAETFFTDYHENNKEEDEESLKNEDGTFGSDLSYQSIITDTVLYNEANFLSVGRFAFDYSGGAHGNYSTAFSVYDLSTHKVITLDDIISVDSEILKKALEKAAKKQLTDGKTSLGDILNSETFDPTLNIALTNKGVLFAYAPYEIASFAQGEIRLFVPFEEIKEALKPEFKKRMGL